MNSGIIELLYCAGQKIIAAAEKSCVWKLFMRIYGVVASWWAGSGLVGFAKTNKVFGRQSVTYKLLRLPFAALTVIQSKIAIYLERCIQHSVLLCFYRTFLQSFLALNTRFFGTMLLGAAGAYSAAYIISGGFSAAGLAGVIIGALLALTDYNISDFCAGSVLFGFAKDVLGFSHIHGRIFDKSKAGCRASIVGAAVVGIASGLLAPAGVIFSAAVPFGLFAFGIIMMYPAAGVFLAAAAAPFVPTMALAGLCLLTGASLLIKSICDPGFKWRFGGAAACFVMWLVILLVSSWFSFARSNSLMVCAMYFVFVGFFFITINSLRTKEQVFALCRVFVIAAVGVAIYGILQYIFGWTTENAWIDETMFEEETMRVYSTLGNPNVLGEYLLLALPLSAVFMVYYKREDWAKWFYAAAFVILLGCLVLTQSRGCWLGFFLGAVIFICFYNGKLWAAALVLMAVIPYIVPQSIISRFMSVGDMADTSTSYRVFIWMGVLKMLRYHFIGGIGMGEEAFGKIYAHYAYNTIVAPHSHNTFLQITVESGVVSLAVFVAAMAIMFRYMYSVYHYYDRRRLESVAALAIGAGLAAFLLQSMFDYTFYNYRVMAIFFMYTAVGTALYHAVREEAQQSE